VPVNKNIGIAAILEAADDYFAQTGRRITYEYVLLRGQNDSPQHATELGRLLSGRAAHVNLIPMNAIGDLPYAEPGEPQSRAFFDILAKHGVVTTVRKRKGADIDAACGQLRLEREREEIALVDLAASAHVGV
jgi:23S rRNA (adenine2503-C2)-methyltransferase